FCCLEVASRITPTSWTDSMTVVWPLGYGLARWTAVGARARPSCPFGSIPEQSLSARLREFDDQLGYELEEISCPAAAFDTKPAPPRSGRPTTLGRSPARLTGQVSPTSEGPHDPCQVNLQFGDFGDLR